MRALKLDSRVFALAVALSAGAASCEPQPAAQTVARTWPAGVVLAIDEVPIYASEVDQASAAVQLVEPTASPAQLRRLALSNIVLPRALAHAMAPSERAAALKLAQDKLAELRQGVSGPPRPDGLAGEKVEGMWTDLGLGNWYAALELPDEQWSEPLEDSGSFVLLRRLWRRDGPVPMATAIAVDALRFDWLDAAQRRALLDAALDQHKLEIVDPAWREIVPEFYQYRMGARR